MSRASRSKVVRKLAEYLSRYGSPRVQLFMILLITGVIGVGCSFILLRGGMHAMWLRYPLAASLAYLGFILMIRRWAARQVDQAGLDLGRFKTTKKASRSRGSGSSGAGWWDFFDLPLEVGDDEGCLLLVLVIVVILVLVTMIAIAPVILAEGLLDGLIVAGLYRRFKRKGRTESVWGSVRATIGMAIVVIVCLGLIGYLVERMEPDARSIGDIFRSQSPS